MPAKKTSSAGLLGAWAFLIGVLLAVILGFAVSEISSTMAIVLAVLGILIGLFNIGAKESGAFLLAVVSLVIVSYFASSANVLVSVSWLARIFNALMVLFVPTTVVVALKQVFSIARR